MGKTRCQLSLKNSPHFIVPNLVIIKQMDVDEGKMTTGNPWNVADPGHAPVGLIFDPQARTGHSKLHPKFITTVINIYCNICHIYYMTYGSRAGPLMP